MSVRSVVVAALMAAAVLSPTVSAAPSDHLVFTAASSASVDFTVTDMTSPTGEKPTFTGGGRFAGIVIEALGEREAGRVGTRVFAAVSLRTVSEDVHMLAMPDRMPPGRYRATVLADRPVQVIVRLSGGGTGAALRATRPVVARLAMTTATRDAVAADGRTALEARLRGAIPRDSESVIVSRVAGQRVDTFRVCAAAAGRGCPSQLLPFRFPAALGALEPDAGSPSYQDGVGARIVPPSATVRDAVASLEGVRNGRTTLVLASLSFRRV